MRNTDDSGKTVCSVSLSASADLEVVAEGLLDDHARILGATGAAERRDDGREHARRDGQVVGRAAGRAELLAQRREGGVVVVVAVDVAQQLQQLLEGRLVDAAAVLGEAVAGALAQLLERPARLGDADDRHREVAAADHRLQRREDLLVGQVAGGPEEHQGVGVGRGHGFLSMATSMSRQDLRTRSDGRAMTARAAADARPGAPSARDARAAGRSPVRASCSRARPARAP